MNGGLIAQRYAKALILFANENKSASSIYEDAKSLIVKMLNYKDLNSIIESPVLTNTQKTNALTLAYGKQISADLIQFINILFINKRQEYLLNILLKYVDMYRKENNIHFVKLGTATAITSIVENKLLKLVTDKEGGIIELEKTIDATLLGGFQLEVDFVRWDGSILNQLQHIKNEFKYLNKQIVL